jgi:hypothetical protein
MRKLLLYLLIFFLFSETLHAQYSLYQDAFQGGVTAAGYSPGTGTPGTGYFTIYIAPGSTIRKAYLLAGKQGPVNSVTVFLNGNAVTFDTTTAYTFFYSLYGGTASVHAADITTVINATDTNYALDFPGGNTGDTYTDFYMYVAYDNPLLSFVHTAIFLNDNDFAQTMTFDLDLDFPVTFGHVGLSVSGGYMCNPTDDGEYIYVNSNYIGKIGGADTNSDLSCGGVMGSYYYQYGNLYGLNDDSADPLMDSSDALSNISAWVNFGDTLLTVTCVHDTFGSQEDNSVWLMTVAYGSKFVEINSPDNDGATVYPNPVKDVLKITSGNNELTEICIYDVSSRLLIKKIFRHSAFVNVSHLRKGIYFYEMRNEEGAVKKGRIRKE